MAVAEGAATRVLTGDADVVAVEQQRAERQRLAEAPLHLAAVPDLGPVLQLLGSLGMDVEALRRGLNSGEDAVEGWARNARVDGRQHDGGLRGGREIGDLRRRRL